MKLSKGIVAFLILIILAAFVYGNYIYIYTPRMERIKQLDRDIEITAQKIAEGRRIAARLEPLKKEYAALREKLAFLEVMLPKEKEIPDFLIMIQDTLTEFGVDFTNFAYLDRIEHLPRVVDVKSLRLVKSAEGVEKLSIGLNMFTYVLRKEATE